MHDSRVLQVLKVPGLTALGLVEVQLIVRVRLGQVGQVPGAQLVHKRLRCRRRIEQSLLIEVALGRVLQVREGLLLLVALLLLHSVLKVGQDIVHVAEALLLRGLVLIRLRLISALPLLQVLALECRQLLASLGSLTHQHRLLGVDSVRALAGNTLGMNDIVPAVRSADLMLNSLIVKVFPKSGGRMLLQLRRLLTNPRLREEILQSGRLVLHLRPPQILSLVPLARVDLVNPKILLALPRLQVE